MTKKTVVAALLTVATALLLISASCKESKKITGPDIPDPNDYSLVLSGNDTMRYFVDNENIIRVRVFNGETVPTGVRIYWRTESNISYIDDDDRPILAQSDTNAFPCGTNPCMDFHCDDTTVAKDAVFAFAVVNAETVATASLGFFLKH